MLKFLNITSKHNIRLFIMALLSVILCSFLIVFLFSLINGISNQTESEIFPEDMIELKYGRSEFWDTVSLFSGKTTDSPAAIEDKLSELKKIEGVTAVYPKIQIKFPSQIYGGKEIFNVDAGLDIIGEGIPSHLLKEDKLSVKFMDYSNIDSKSVCSSDKDCNKDECCWIYEGENRGLCRHPVPFVISPRLIEFYNSAVAPTHNMIRIPSWMVNKLSGLKAKMVIGRSYQSKAIKGTPENICAIFSGISNFAPEIGIGVPYNYVQDWNERYLPEYKKGSFTSAIIKIAEKKKLGEIIQKSKHIGFKAVTGGKEEVGYFIVILGIIFSIIIIIITAVAGMAVSHVFYSVVMQRKKEIAIMRVLGASSILIKKIVTLQGFIIGLIGSIIGCIFAVIFCFIADHIAVIWIPEFPFKPRSFFSFELWVFILSISLSCCACIIGSYFPARWIASQTPMEILS